jgi:hypothetical protein
MIGLTAAQSLAAQAPPTPLEPSAEKKDSEKKAAEKKDAEKKDNEPPRRSYNQARAAFAKNDLAAAVTGFLAARDHAEGDEEVRYRSAFNLALTYARQADGLIKDKPQEALSTLEQSAAWFRDAVRARPDDADARYNLELVLRRLQQLADQLNKGQNTLQARLSRVIQDERTLRDRVRTLLSRVNQAGAAAEPLNFQSEFEDIANFQRTLLSDAGAILDLAGDQRDHLSQKKDQDLTDEERGTLVQLQNLEHYLNLSRGTMAEVARLLRKLQGDRAHQEADAAVTLLKRALEQLQDPVTVLKGLVADQTSIMGQTVGLDGIRKGTLRLPAEGGKEPQKAEAPAWLTSSFLSEEQKQLQPRGNELLARLRAGVEHESKQGDKAEEKKPPSDPREAMARQRMVEAAKLAIPLLQEATEAMERATSSLGSDELPAAQKAQEGVLLGLLKALERFSGIRDLIELAFADQSRIVALLDRDPKSELAKLSTQERTAFLKESVAHNQDRLGRLKDLFSDELQALQAPQGQSDPSKKEEQEKVAAEKQRYEMAEQKRKLAETAVNQLSDMLNGKGGAMQPTAEEGRKHIEDLRRLFFSIVEHLKELLRNQTETHDKTSSAQATKDEEEKKRRLGPLGKSQQEHAAMGKAIAEALAGQADQAQNSADEKARQAQKTLADAAEEVRKAQGTMETAARMLDEDEKQAATLSPDLESPLDQQKQSMEHLEAAIHILEPPEQQQNQDQKKQQQNQDQQISQEQAARRLQAIREREAERQRKQQQPSQPEPVEKDW